MPEATNQQGGGVRLSGLQAGQVAPTTGSVGRLDTTNKALTTALQGLAGGISTEAAILQGQRAGAARGAAAARAADINTIGAEVGEAKNNLFFATASGQSNEDVLNSALGQPVRLPDDAPPEAQAAFQRLQMKRDQLKTLLAQVPEGDRQLKYDLAKRYQDQQFIAAHPAYTKELHALSGELDPSKDDWASAQRQFAQAEKIQQAQTDHQLTALNAAGYSVPPNSSPEQVHDLYESTGLGKDLRDGHAISTQLELTQSNNTLTEEQRKARTRDLVVQYQPIRTRSLTMSLRQIADNPALTDPAARTMAVQTTRTKFIEDVKRKEGIATLQEMKDTYPAEFQMLDDAEKAASGQLQADVAKNQYDYIEAGQKLDFTKKYGVEVKYLNGYLVPASKLYTGPGGLPAALLSGKNGPATKAVFDRYMSGIALTAAGLASGRPQGDVVFPQDYDQLGAQDKQAIANTVKGEMSHYMNIYSTTDDAKGREFMQARFQGLVNDTVSKRGGGAWDDALDAMDSKNFPTFVKDAGVSPDDLKQAAINTDKYISQCALAITNLEKSTGVSLQQGATFDPDNGTIILDPKVLSQLSKPDQDTAVRLAQRLSKAGRVMHYGFGQGTSVMGAVAQSLAGAGAVQ